MINYQKFYEVMEKNANEGIDVLAKMPMSDPRYMELMTNIVETINTINQLNESVPSPKNNADVKEFKLKPGDEYKGFNGNKDKTKVVIFTSPNCGFCEAMKPVFIPEIEKAGIPIEMVDFKDQAAQEFGKEMGIRGVPQLMFIKDNKFQHVQIGFNKNDTEENNKALINKLINDHLK